MNFFEGGDAVPPEVVNPGPSANQSRREPTLPEAEQMAAPSSTWQAPPNLRPPAEKFPFTTPRNYVEAESYPYQGRLFSQQWTQEPSWTLFDGRGQPGLTFRRDVDSLKGTPGSDGCVMNGGRGGNGFPGENAQMPHPGGRGSTYFTTLRNEGGSLVVDVTETKCTGEHRSLQLVKRLDDADFGLEFRAPGGNGGDGGRGGDGGDGGRGANGMNATDTEKSTRGGKGGNGGQPGHGTSGANGGAGGDLVFNVSKGRGEYLLMAVKDLDDPTKIELAGGQGGKPGMHGTVGKPGVGGSHGIGINRYPNIRMPRLNDGRGEAKLLEPLPMLVEGRSGPPGRVCICVENEGDGKPQYWASRYVVKVVKCTIRPADSAAGNELFFGSRFEVCDFKLLCGGGMPAPPLLGIHVEEVEHATGIERDVISYHEGFLPGYQLAVNAATGGRVQYPKYAITPRINFDDEAVECKLDDEFGVNITPDRNTRVKVNCRALVVGGPSGNEPWNRLRYHFVRPFLEADVLRASVKCGYPIEFHLVSGAMSLAPGESSNLHLTVKNLSERQYKGPVRLHVWLADQKTSDVKQWVAAIDSSFQERSTLYKGTTNKPLKRTAGANFSLAYPGWIGTLENIKGNATVNVKLRYGLKRSNEDLAYTNGDLRVSLWIYDEFDRGWHLAQRCSLTVVCELPSQPTISRAPFGHGIGVDNMGDQHDVILICSTSTQRKDYTTWVGLLQDKCGLSVGIYPISRRAQFPSNLRSVIFILDKPFRYTLSSSKKVRPSQALKSTDLRLASDQADEDARVAALVVIDDHNDNDDDDPPAFDLRRLLRMPRSDETIDLHLRQSGNGSYLSQHLRGMLEPTEDTDIFHHGAEDLIDAYFDDATKLATQRIYPLRLEVYDWTLPGASFMSGDERKMSVRHIQKILERAAQKLRRKLIARHPTVAATIVYTSEIRDHPVNTQSTADLKENKARRGVMRVKKEGSTRSKAIPKHESSKWGWFKHRTRTPWSVGYLLVYLRREGATTSVPRVHYIKLSDNDLSPPIPLAAATGLTRHLKFKGLSNILKRDPPPDDGMDTLCRALLADVAFEVARLIADSPPGLRGLRMEDGARLTERYIPTVDAMLTKEKSTAAGAPCGLEKLTGTAAAEVLVNGIEAMCKIPNYAPWDPTQRASSSTVLARAQDLLGDAVFTLKARWKIRLSHGEHHSKVSDALQAGANPPHPAFIDVSHLRDHTRLVLHALIAAFTPRTCLLSASHVHPIEIISGYEQLEDRKAASLNLNRARDAFENLRSARSNIVQTT